MREESITDKGQPPAGSDYDQLTLLRHAGDALSAALDIDAALASLGEVLVPALADWFSLDLVDGGTITNVLVMHPDPQRVQLAKELQRRFPSDPEAPTGTPYVIRTGESQLTERITDEMLQALIEDPELLTLTRELDLRCAMVVPLIARGRTIGAITMLGAETHERYVPADLRLAEEIADRAALAIDTARLLEAENQARLAAIEEARRSEILQASTAAFGTAGTVDEVVSAMLDEGIRRAGATAGTVGVLEDERRVVLRGLTGYQPSDEPYWSEFLLDDPLPLADAIKRRRPVVLSTTPERDERYPALAGRGEQRDHALVCVPLVLGGTVVGGFAASYPPGMAFGESDLSLLLSIGEQCAQAIDRARSREANVRARARLDAVAAASRALAQTLDLDATIATAMRLAAEHFGRAVSLVRFERDRVIVEAGEPATEVSDGGILELIEGARDRAVGYVLAPDPNGSDQTILVLPLEIAGRTSGAVVVREPAIDTGDREALAFSAEIVRRIARALENARLYRDRDEVARTLQGAFLPPSLPDVPGLDVDALFVPAERGKIGGDFFDLFPTTDGRWVAVVGDVCGKGIQAATLTAMARHTLRAVADVGPPSVALGALNAAMLRADLDGRFCTVVVATIERPGDGTKVTVASGGHPLPQLLSNDGRTRSVGEHGTLLGLVEQVRLHDAEVRLEPGEALVLFTDGLIPKREASGEQPGRLLQRLRGRTWGSAAEIRAEIEAYVDELGGERYDDIAVLVLRAT